jgi:hypothetical protein
VIVTDDFKFTGVHQKSVGIDAARDRARAMGMQVRQAAEELFRLLDPEGLLDSLSGPRRPLLILAFDEGHALADILLEHGSLFEELVHALYIIADLPIFSLFLSTAAKFYVPLPSNLRLHTSGKFKLPLPPPISETCFDDLAFPAIEDTLILNQVIVNEWISHLGRPLYVYFVSFGVSTYFTASKRFGSHYDATMANKEDREYYSGKLMHLAKTKLLGGPIKLDDVKGLGSLACLSVRFALDFDLADKSGRDVALTLVERHMRLCVAASTQFEKVITIAGSEPYLAEAARELMSDVGAVRLLAENSSLDHIDLGRRGELVAALLVMRARDASAVAAGSRVVSVTDFMTALLPVPAYEMLKSAKPQYWQSGEDKPFSEAFEGYTTWFNHVIKVQDTDMIKTEHLWKFITRGAMVMCMDSQLGIDFVIPVCARDDKLSRRSVTAILIQVKSDESFKCQVDKHLLGCMDPTRIGFFSEDNRPLPVIRMVFALGSDKAGVVFPTVEEGERDVDAFTAYDIWCAGLSPDTFRDIGTDLEWYKTLFQRSLQSHDVFEVKDAKEKYRNEETELARGRQRRKMAPLSAPVESHSYIHDAWNFPGASAIV